MAKPFREGNGWSFRLRIKGQDEYRSGFPSEAAANNALNRPGGLKMDSPGAYPWRP